MIISKVLETFFTGMTVDIVNLKGEPVSDATIQFGYGDRNELNRWIDRNKTSTVYPLIWYLKGEFVEENGWLETVEETQLILFQSTTVDLFNTQRSSLTYENVLAKVSKEVIRKLEKSNSFEFISSNSGKKNKYRLYDEPLFGEEIDDKIKAYNSSGKNDKSIIIDTVDARIIYLKFRINTQCI